MSLTDVQDSLFGRVLPGVPILPVLELLVPVLVFTEHHHDHALRGRDLLHERSTCTSVPRSDALSGVVFVAVWCCCVLHVLSEKKIVSPELC